LQGVILSTEIGLIILDEKGAVVAAERFPLTSDGDEVAFDTEFVRALVLKAQQGGVSGFVVSDASLAERIHDIGIEAILDPDLPEKYRDEKDQLLMKSGLFGSDNEAKEYFRESALAASKKAIQELSTHPDLQIMQGIGALDEVDKSLNLANARTREWFGLHFPELNGLISDPTTFTKIAARGQERSSLQEESLSGLNFSEKKVDAILTAADDSKGGKLRPQDLRIISSLAENTVGLAALRDKLSEYVKREMTRTAPNISSVAGETIGARLIAKAGGLAKLARLPSSTIQVLGAEKALFRALKSGGRPPKHGILFQHDDVHGSPLWQRGKIARSLANKIALAARVDYYRGTKADGLAEALEKRLAEIRVKYKEPTKRMWPTKENKRPDTWSDPSRNRRQTENRFGKRGGKKGNKAGKGRR
jgi:nucleolar protein 56